MSAPASTTDARAWASVELPTTGEEIWRYSRIEELRLDEFAPVPYEPTLSPDVAPATVTIAEHGAGPAPDLFADEPAPDVFAELNRQGATTVHITVPAGAVVAAPIVVTHRVPAGNALVRPRLVIEAGPDAEVTVIERFGSQEAGRALVLPVLQIAAAAAARVTYLAVNDLSEQTWAIGHQQATGDRDSSIFLATVALGGDYSRVRTDARVTGPGASTRQVALYFAGGQQMHDFRTIQDHAAPHTNSDLLFKGAVQGRSRSVYTGLIRIRENAKGTVAYQTNRNLTLSEGAWAESVPNLDIQTNDVKCSHASTVGPIDPEQRFYLESRGVRPEVAERLVVLGFFDEVLAQLPSSPAVADLRDRVAAKLELGAPEEPA